MRRAVLARLRPDVGADEGISLVETVVALMVFALFMTGLAGGLVLLTHTTVVTKVRNAATALAQQTMEQAKAQTLTNLAVCTGGGAPANYQPSGMTTSYPVITGAAPCVPFSQTVSTSGYSFTVNQYVLSAKTSPAGAAQPVIEKIIDVKVTWTHPSTGTYELNSASTGNTATTATSATGVQLNVLDNSTSPATLVGASALAWDYTVTDSTGNAVASGATDDGTSGLLSLSAGTYTCSLAAEPDAAASYNPDSANNSGKTLDALNDVISGTCTVTTGNVLAWNTNWVPVVSCAASTTKGAIQVTVTDNTQQLVSGATVTLTNYTTGVVTSLTGTTSSSGVAQINNVPDDQYTYIISKTGYTSSQALGPVCVAGTQTSQVTGSIASTLHCPSVTTKGTLVITVQDENGNPVPSAKIVLVNQTTHHALASVNTNASGVYTYNNNLPGDSYTYEASKANYTDQGAQGPICVTAGNSMSISALLPTQASSGCASSATKGSLSVTITDQNGSPVQNVSIALTNANGHGGAPGAVKTNASGVALFNNNAPADLYYFTPTPPAGYTSPGVQGPVCVIAGQTVSATATLASMVTIKVMVTNNDIQPTKTYNITLTDSGNSVTTGSLTVNSNKTGTSTFTNMDADPAYTVQVCAVITSTGNCDAITNGTTSYSFNTVGQTYTVAVTDAKGGA